MISAPIRIIAICLVFGISVGHGRAPSQIHGGKYGRIKESPYIVSLRISHSHSCGGCIIGERHVLSVAHCVSDKNGKTVDGMTVLSGTADQGDENTGQVYNVNMIILHENYSHPSLRNDIAVLKLSQPIFFNSIRQPILLPTSNIQPDVKATVTGWGKLEWTSTAKASKYLQRLRVHIISASTCQNEYHFLKIFPEVICTAKCNGCGICPGDSGSPLIQGDQLIGIAIGNFHLFPGHDVPDIYTRVHNYVPWIRDVMLL